MIVELCFFLTAFALVAFISAFIPGRRIARARSGAIACVLKSVSAMLFLYEVISFVWNEGIGYYMGFGRLSLAFAVVVVALGAAAAAYNASMLEDGLMARLASKLRFDNSSRGAAVGAGALACVIAFGFGAMRLLAEAAYADRVNYEDSYMYGIAAAALAAVILALVGLCASIAAVNAAKLRAGRGGDTTAGRAV